MALKDVSQIQRMVRAVLQRVGAPSRREDANGDASRPQPETALRTDSVRVSGDAQRQLADQVLRVLSEAARSTPEPGQSTTPVSSSALDTVLADRALRAELVNTFSRPAVAQRLPEFLANPDLQEVATRLLTHEDMQAVADRLLQSPDATEAFSRLLANKTTRDPALTLLSRPNAETVAREAILQIDSADTLARVVESPQGRAIVARAIAEHPDAAPRLLQALAEHANPPESPRENATRSLLRSSSSNVLTLARPEMRAAATSILQTGNTARPYLEILANEPGGVDLAREVLNSPAPREAFRAALAQADTAETALRLLTNQSLTDVARDIATQPQSEGMLRQALASQTGSRQDRLALALTQAIAQAASADGSDTESLANLRRILTDESSSLALANRFEHSTQWRRALVDALAQLPSGGDARRWIERPATQEALARFLASAPSRGNEADKTTTLRLLLSIHSGADAAGSNAARTLLNRPETIHLLTSMLGQTQTRLTASDALAQPEMTDAANRILNSAEGARALRAIATDTAALPAATRLLSQPQAAQAVLTQMAQNATPEQIAQLLRNPEFERRLPELLDRPETARPVMELLARAVSSQSGEAVAQAARLAVSSALSQALPERLASPDTRAFALELLSRPEVATELTRLLETPQALEALSRALQRVSETAPGQPPPQETSLALRILSQADSAQTARLLLDSGQENASAIRNALTRVLADAPLRTDALRTADLTNALRLLAHDTTESVARAVLRQPEAMDQLGRWMAQSETRATVLELIERPSMGDVLQRILQHPEARRALLNHALSTGSDRELARLLSGNPETARALLTGLARPESAAATQRILAYPTLQNEAARLLSQPSTRDALLDVLARPEFSARTAEILARPDVQAELIQSMSQQGTRERLTAILDSLGGARGVEQMASRPEFLQAALRSLTESPQSAAAALGILRRSAPDPVVAQVLESNQWQEAASRLIGNDTTREAALGLLARASSENPLRATLATPEGEQALRAALQTREGQQSGRATVETNWALRLLARPEMTETRARFASEPQFQRLMARLLTQDSTQSTALRLMQAPEMRELSRVIFAGRGGEYLALDLVARRPAAPAPAQVLQSPEATEALLRAFQRDPNNPAATRIFQSPAVQTQLAQALQTDSSLRASLLRILDSPLRTDAATRILTQPEAIARIPEILQARATTAPVLRILARMQQGDSAIARNALRDAFSDTRAIAGVARLFTGRAATNADTSPGSAVHTALRILAAPGMGEAARQVFESPEARAALVRILADAVRLGANAPSGATSASAPPNHMADNVGEILRLLERPELAGATHRLLDTPEMRARLADLLAGAPREGRLASPDNALSILRILSRPETGDAARDVLARADVQERLPILLQDSRTRASALQLLLRPEVADVAARTFNTPEGRQAILETLASPESASRTLARILTSPASSRTAAAILATMQGAEAVDRLLARPEVLDALPRLLQTSESRHAVLRILARHEHAEIAARVLLSPDTQTRMSESVASRQSDASTWLDILARPEARETARAWLERPQNIDALRTLLVERPETQEAVFRLLAQPAARDAAARVFSNPEAIDTLARAAVSQSPTPSPAPAESAQLQSQALRILAQTEMADALRAIVSQNQNQAAIAQALGRDENRQVLLAILTERRHRDTARILIQRTEVREALLQALRNEGTQRLAQLLQDNETATRVLEAMRQGDTEAIQRLLSGENGMRQAIRLLSQSRPRHPLLQLLSAPENASAALRLLSRTPTRAAIMPLLESGEARPWIESLQRTAPRELAPILSHLAAAARTGAGISRETGNWIENQLALAGRSNERTATTPLSRNHGAPDLLTRIRNATHDEVVGALVNRSPGPANARGSLSWVFDNLPMTIQRLFGPMNPLAPPGQALASRATLNQLASAAERLHNVSPQRSQPLMRTLAALSRLGGRNIDTVLQQIARRVETMAQQLAQKGGLPASLSEPTLAQSSLLMIRLPGLATGQLAPLAEALAANGVEIAFVGRNATGTAQIQIQLAELAPGSPERPDSHLPGLTRHANLTPAERTRLGNVLALDRPGRAHGWTHGGVLNSDLSERYEREEIVVARARQAIQIERLQIRAADPNAPGTATTRPEVAAATTFAFNYHLAAMFPWFNFNAPVLPAAATAARLTEDGEVIPSMLDLVAMEPLLLTYELDELLGDEVTTISAQARRATMS